MSQVQEGGPWDGAENRSDRAVGDEAKKIFRGKVWKDLARCDQDINPGECYVREIQPDSYFKVPRT